MSIDVRNPVAVKQYIKDEYHTRYDEFLADLDSLDQDEIWVKHYNDGDLSDGSLSPFRLLSSSDETFYCMENGYFNDIVFNDAFHALDTGDKIRFVDEWLEIHEQEM